MGQNVVARHLGDEEWTQLDEAIARVYAILGPMLVPVTPQAKKALVKMGEGSEAFCRQSYNVMRENIDLMPRSLDLDEMRRDLDSHDALNERIVKLTRLLEQARDTEIALGSDVMVSALEGYAVLKAVGKGDGVQALRRQLGKRFETGARIERAEPVADPA
jgi:hypothetical protein